VFIFGCATGGVAAQLVVPPVRAGTAPARWSTSASASEPGGGDGITSTLNKLGAEGWELASAAPSHQAAAFGSHDIDAFLLCAKRALP
jgi:hypothetical protein